LGRHGVGYRLSAAAPLVHSDSERLLQTSSCCVGGGRRAPSHTPLLHHHTPLHTPHAAHPHTTPHTHAAPPHPHTTHSRPCTSSCRQQQATAVSAFALPGGLDGRATVPLGWTRRVVPTANIPLRTIITVAATRPCRHRRQTPGDLFSYIAARRATCADGVDWTTVAAFGTTIGFSLTNALRRRALGVPLLAF